MCLAVPGRIEKIEGEKAIVDFGGLKKEVDVTFAEDVGLGDYVLVHVGFVIQKVDEVVAKETYRLLAEIETEDKIKEELTHG